MNMSRKSCTLLLAVILACAFLGSSAQQTSVPSGLAPVTPSFQSYQAHIAAAASALRLDETSEAKRWLAAAPQEYRNWEWRYLSAQAEQSAAVIAAHDAVLTSIAISPDGTRIATSASDKTVKLWQVPSGRELATLRSHAAPATSVTFRSDGKLLATGSYDGTIKLWEISVQRKNP